MCLLCVTFIKFIITKCVYVLVYRVFGIGISKCRSVGYIENKVHTTKYVSVIYYWCKVHLTCHKVHKYASVVYVRY